MEDLTQYPYLFDRRRSSHPWLESLNNLQNDSYPENMALAHNWRMDHRVSANREQTLVDSGQFPSAKQKQNFNQSIREYFQAHLCLSTTLPASPLPAYLRDNNLYNRIAKDHIVPRQKLIHLASFNSLLKKTLQHADLQLAIEDLTGMYPPASDTPGMQQIDSIARALQARGEGNIRELAGLISDHLDPEEPHWWAAFTSEVNDHLQGDGWTTAANILGLGHLEKGEWLMAWQYSAELAGPLYRPTVVEAGNYGFHFPSPPEETLGITRRKGNHPCTAERGYQFRSLYGTPGIYCTRTGIG